MGQGQVEDEVKEETRQERDFVEGTAKEDTSWDAIA